MKQWLINILSYWGWYKTLCFLGYHMDTYINEEVSINCKRLKYTKCLLCQKDTLEYGVPYMQNLLSDKVMKQGLDMYREKFFEYTLEISKRKILIEKYSVRTLHYMLKEFEEERNRRLTKKNIYLE